MKRILFVDDDPNLLEGLRRMLRPQRSEWHMSFANGGKEALAILDAEAFDVIVTDMRMPEMDGARLLEHVQDRHPSVVRIVLSGHVEMEAAVRAAPVAHQFLSKPCDPDKLRAAIQRACDCRARVNAEDIRRVIGAIGQLPSLPATCSSLLAALEDPDVSLIRITKIIGQDVGITAKVLQLVNSAFFGVRNEVTDVRAAVNYLGLDTLKQLVLSVQILRTFHPPPALDHWLNEFEAHCRLVAQIASSLPVPGNLVSTTVVAALLHDTGKLVLASRLPAEFEYALQTARQESIPLYTAEEKATGINHAQVGAYLLDLWGLPETIVEAARDHHQPAATNVSEQGLSILAATHVADALAHEVYDQHTAEGSRGFEVLNSDFVGGQGMSEQVPVWRELAREAMRISL